MTSNFYLISDWDRENLVIFNAFKAKFLHLSSRSNLSEVYPLFFDNKHNSSSSLNNLGVIYYIIFPWKDHISDLAKTTPEKWGVLQIP